MNKRLLPTPGLMQLNFSPNQILRKIILFVCICFIGVFAVKAQNVQIQYSNPDELIVCDSAEFSITIFNNEATQFTSVNLSIDLPAGVEYLPESIFDASENDLSDLSAPVFLIPILAPMSIHTVSFRARAICEITDLINSGSLFSNYIKLTAANLNVDVNTLHYDVEMPLTVISSITEDIIQADIGDVVTRTICIKNTRNGKLSMLTFSDVNTGFVDISTDIGQVTGTSMDAFELTVSGDDFMQVGNGDEYLDLDEEICITETITVNDCDQTEFNLQSSITVSWGCNDRVCQSDFKLAYVLYTSILPFIDLDFEVFTEPLTSICGDIPFEQGVTVTNNSDEKVYSIVVQIVETNIESGIDEFSPKIDSAGFSIPLNSTLFLEQTDTCVGFGSPKYHRAFLEIECLSPGESVYLSWDVYGCGEFCSRPRLGWYFDYTYELLCPRFQYAGPTTTGQNPDDLYVNLETDLRYYIGHPLVDGGIYDMNYLLSSDFVDDMDGTLRIEITSTCGLEWLLDDFNLGGVYPNILTVSTDGDYRTVLMEFDLPLPSTDFFEPLQVQLICDSVCIPEIKCPKIPQTSCQDPCVSIFDTIPPIPPVEIFMVTQLILDENIPEECRLADCKSYELVADCASADTTCIDIIPGGLNVVHDFHRTNIGKKDDDNDRIKDSDQTQQIQFTRHNRFMTGDTSLTTVEGTVFVDVPDTTFRYATLSMAFVGMQSYAGFEDFPALDLMEGELLMQGDGIRFLDCFVDVYDVSTDETYTVALPYSAIRPNVDVVISIVNTNLVDIVDIGKALIYSINVDAEDLIDLGAPANFRFDEDDVITFKVRHAFDYNLVALQPNIANLTTQVFSSVYNNILDSKVSCPCPTIPFQLTGYRESFDRFDVDVPVCESSDTVSHTVYQLELGVPNFFPFEHREITHLDRLEFILPNFINLVYSSLSTYEIQDGLVLNNDLALPNTGTGLLSIDFDALQLESPDEGFSADLSMAFQVDCERDIVINLQSKLFIDRPHLLPDQTNPDTLLSRLFIDPLAPKMSLSPLVADITSFSDMAMWEFTITNSDVGSTGDALFSYIQPVSITGLLYEFELIDVESGMTIPSVDGIFQLGTFLEGSSRDFKLIAKNVSCNPEFVNLYFGWNCTEYNDANQESCIREEERFSVISPPGELELEFDGPTGEYELCEELPYFTATIFNAQLGDVYDVLLDITLPEGLTIVPGSSQILYPEGGNWESISDPIWDGSQFYLYDLDSLNQTIREDGLLGFNQPPYDKVQIRFKAVSECGFLAGTFVIAHVSAYQNCNEPTNDISKSSPPILLKNVTPIYSTEFDVEAEADLLCGEDAVVHFLVINDGLTGANDSLVIHLPEGISYIPGSYQPLTNAHPSEPTVVDSAGLEILYIKIQEGLNAGFGVTFDLSLSGLESLPCDGTWIDISAFSVQVATCISTGEECEAIGITGIDSFFLNSGQAYTGDS